MIRRLWAISVLVAGVLALPAAAPAQEIPQPDQWVTDLAGYLDDGEEQELEELLNRYRLGSSGNAVAVLTVEKLGGRDLEGYALQAAREWKLGEVGKDNGVLLLVAKEERRIRIEVGRGLEGELTDLVCGRIIDLIMVPEFRAGRPAAGIRAGVAAILAAAGGDLSAIPERVEGEEDGGGVLGWILLLAFLLLIGGGGRRGGFLGRRGGSPWLWFLLGNALGHGSGRRAGSFGGLRGGGGGFGGFRGGGFGGFGGGGGFSGGGASGGW